MALYFKKHYHGIPRLQDLTRGMARMEEIMGSEKRVKVSLPKGSLSEVQAKTHAQKIPKLQILCLQELLRMGGPDLTKWTFWKRFWHILYPAQIVIVISYFFLQELRWRDRQERWLNLKSFVDVRVYAIKLGQESGERCSRTDRLGQLRPRKLPDLRQGSTSRSRGLDPVQFGFIPNNFSSIRLYSRWCDDSSHLHSLVDCNSQSAKN